MFTRNEFFMLLFMAVFGIAGAVLNRVRSDRGEVKTTVELNAFAIKASAPPDTLSADSLKKTLKMECVKININSAGLQDLMQLQGIGRTLGERIIECRGRLGGFKTKRDLLKVKGLGKKRLEKLDSYIEI